MSVLVWIRSCILAKNTNNMGGSMGAVVIFGGDWWILPMMDIIGGDMSLRLIFHEEFNCYVSRDV